MNMSRWNLSNSIYSYFGWVVLVAVGWVWVWGFWAVPGLVWMGCVVFAVALLWGGSLLAASHQSSNTVSCCW